MWPSTPWNPAPKIDEPWGFVNLCGTCSNKPAELRSSGEGISCKKHDPLDDDLVVQLEDAAAAAWPQLTIEERYDRVGDAVGALRSARARGVCFPEHMKWAWELWNAAVRMDQRQRR